MQKTNCVIRKLLIFFLAAVPVIGMAQTVSIKGNNVPLKKVFSEIKKQTGYTFFYKPVLLENAEKVTIDIHDMPLDDALELLFSNQPITYSYVGKIITLSKKAPVFVIADSATKARQSFVVSGTVHNSAGQPLDGASVAVQRTGKGTITNARGEFTLKNPSPTDTLRVSFIGYNSTKVPISGQTHLNIVLNNASNQLDEVVMQAYSRTSQRFATGDITKVTAAEIERQPVMNPLLALQGRVPGLIVTPTTGFASSPVSIQIRGLNSLNSQVPTDPLYVIDGVPLSVLPLKSLDAGGLGGGDPTTRVSSGFIQQVGINGSFATQTTGGQSLLFSINPEDIESIEILKDADATAVYGSRGSNGVILITTKKGKPGATQFNFHIDPPFLSFGKPTSYLKMLDTRQYLEMRREGFKNDGTIPTLLNAPDLLLWDTTRYTDWQKKTNGGLARSLNITTGVSGGTDQTAYRINANYTKLTNTSNISGSTQRATMAANFNSSTRDRKFSFNLSSQFSYSYVDVIPPVVNPWFAPNAPPIFDKKGNPNWADWSAGGLLGNYSYPFAGYLSPANPQSTTTTNNSLLLSYKPFKGLVISTILGYNFSYNSTRSFRTIAAQSPYIANRTGSATFNITQNSGWTINPQVSYTTRLSKGELQLSLIATEQYIATNGSNQTGSGYISDILLGSVSNAPYTASENASSQSRNASFIGAVNYIYDKKYIINLNGTRQGSSKFGPDNKYGNFGSVGAAWIASEEDWLKKMLPSQISFLKFRGSYGLTGSDGIAEYQYLALWQIGTPASTGGYDGNIVLTPSVRPNQKYKWENNTKLEGAMDLGLLKDRISMGVRYYRNRVSNQLTTYPTPGFLNSFYINNLITNVPLLLQNSGWEGEVRAKLVTEKDLNLFAVFNISHNKNVLLSFPGLATSPYASTYAIGLSLNAVALLHSLGTDPLSGLPSFQDFNHNGIVDINSNYKYPPVGSDDRGVIYDLQPRLTGGFGLDGNYKRLSFSVFFTYKKQTGKSIYGNLIGTPGSFNVNQPAAIFDRIWRKPGDIAEYPKFSANPTSMLYYSFGQSDGVYTDASYIRLTNMSVSYALPDAWGTKLGLKNPRVSVNAQNILTITPYKGGDPETQLPFAPPRLYTFRIDFNF